MSVLLSTKRYRLGPGESAVFEVIGEGYIHPLVGSGDFDGQEIGGRRSVFDPPPYGMLVPGGEHFISAKDGPLEFIVACAHEAKRESFQSFKPRETHVIGKGTSRRTVRVILGHGGPSEKLRAGETVNRRGGWSSWPPHSFDKNPANASKFEEHFYCFKDPKDGDAYLVRKGTFRDGGVIDEVSPITSGAVYDIPLGYHPIVAGPGTKLMYVWFYVSPEDKIYPQWAEDVGAYK